MSCQLSTRKGGRQSSIRQDPDIRGLLDRLPAETATSLTDTQLQHLKVAIGSGSWRKHRVDLRGTLSVPFYPARIYFVFLMGRNRRALSRQETHIAFASMLIFVFGFISAMMLLGLMLVYLLKSWLGINLFSDFSLGLWDWFNARL